MNPSDELLGLPPLEGSAPPSKIVAMLRSKRLEAYRNSIIATWSKALRCSVRDGSRHSLTSDELRSGDWQLTFLTEAVDPTPVTFHPERNVMTMEGTSVPYELFDDGRRLHVHIFPALSVSRSPSTWNWSLQNPFVEIHSIGPGLPSLLDLEITSTAVLTPWNEPLEMPLTEEPIFRAIDGKTLAALLMTDAPKCGPKSTRKHNARHCSVNDLLLSGLKRLHLSQDSTFLSIFGERLGARKFAQGPRCADHLRMCGHPSKPP